MLCLTDLREILRYVPCFRDRVFVIALGGAVVADDNCANLLLDIALLRSLRIDVALVHGAGHQIRRLAAETGQTPSNLDGTGITDAATLQLAITAANGVTHALLAGLAANDLRGACSNAVVAHPAGIRQGVDYQRTGRVERIDSTLLRALLERDIIPVIPPLGCDGEGRTYRLNSDAVAVAVAQTLRAVKLVFLTTQAGVYRNGQLLHQLTTEEAEALLQEHRAELSPAAVSKLEQAVRATRAGVPRVHIIDGRVEEGLLAEVFSNEGIGTLVHANEYQAIRRAGKRDVRAILALTQAGVENDELLRRTPAEIESRIEDYYILEVDGNPVACIALHRCSQQRQAEMACVCVDPKYENQGIGARLMQFIEAQARAAQVDRLFCLSTQAFHYFMDKGGFRLGTPDDLPPERRERYEQSGRRSQVLIKDL